MIMKTSTSILFCIAAVVVQVPANAQKGNKALQELIDAERAFARTSRDHGTRVAFLANLAPSARLYTSGEIVNGIEKWNQITADSSLLNWWPIYADVSIAGDLGYTTGPYQYFKDRKDRTPLGNGFYSTVWKREANGEWKVATDLGIQIGEPQTVSEKVDSPKVSGDKTTIENAKKELHAIESKYVKVLNDKSVSFHQGYFADEFSVHRSGNKPATTIHELEQLVEHGKFMFENAGVDIARSGDMAYTFGKVKIEINDNNGHRLVASNYIRIWKRFSSGWKIVLDVIGA